MSDLLLNFATAAKAAGSSLHSVPIEAQLLFIGAIFLGTLIINRFSIRIGDRDHLEAFYSDLGRTLKAQASGWDAWVLSGNAAVTGALRLKASRRIPVSNGGIDCRWLHYQVH